MAEIDINDLASIGSVRDTPAFQLPPEAWSYMLNVRYRDGGVEALGGWAQVFGTLGGAPNHILSILTASQALVVYLTATKAFAYDGVEHREITRESGVYAITKAAEWNSAILGGLVIINNGVDVPQYWANPSLGTKLANLPNWPSNARARIIRALGPYLVALNTVDGGVPHPHLVRWSQPAQPGAVPTSWDVSDQTVDAGEQDLSDVNSGIILDALPLASTLFIYKQASTWRMDIIGGRFIMSFRPFLTTSGILGSRCVTVTGDGTRHVVATQDDIIVHNGNQPESVLDRKMRKYLFENIDSTNYANSFMFTNALKNEVWFCYPSTGQTVPNRAIIWNYRHNALSEADGITFQHAAEGNFDAAIAGSWNAAVGSWNTDPDQWGITRRRQVLLAGTTATKIFNLDSGITRDGVAFESIARRESLALLGKKRTGEWIEDHQRLKMADRFWPKMEGSGITIRLGAQTTVKGTTTWGSYTAFAPASQVHLPMTPISGRALGVEFKGDGTAAWRLDGYKLNIRALGTF